MAMKKMLSGRAKQTKELLRQGVNAAAGWGASGATARPPLGFADAAQTIQRAQYLMARKAFPTDSALADAIGVHRSQISRWKAGESPRPENAWILRDLAFAVEALSEHLSTGSIDPWLRGRMPELDGETPLEAIRAGRIPDVLMAVQAQASGAYA